MRTQAMKDLIELADDGGNSLADIVKNATEDGVVVGSILKAKLEAAGYQVLSETGKKTVKVYVRQEVDGQDVAVAFGQSVSENDALKQAIFASLRGC